MSNEDAGPPPGQGREQQPAPGPPPNQQPPNQPPPSWGAPPPPYGYSPQPPQPLPPYGYQQQPPSPYATTPRPQTDGTAITALVLAIVAYPLSFMCGIGVIAAIVSLALTPSARRNIERSGGALTGESMLTAAKILAWINIGLTSLVLVVLGIGAAAGWWDDDYEYSLRLALTLLG